jgi:hypothetical protein
VLPDRSDIVALHAEFPECREVCISDLALAPPFDLLMTKPTHELTFASRTLVSLEVIRELFLRLTAGRAHFFSLAAASSRSTINCDLSKQSRDNRQLHFMKVLLMRSHRAIDAQSSALTRHTSVQGVSCLQGPP